MPLRLQYSVHPAMIFNHPPCATPMPSPKPQAVLDPALVRIAVLVAGFTALLFGIFVCAIRDIARRLIVSKTSSFFPHRKSPWLTR